MKLSAVLTHCNVCPVYRGTFGHRDTKMCVHRGRALRRQGRRAASEETRSADLFIWTSSKFLLLKLPSLWNFIMVDPENPCKGYCETHTLRTDFSVIYVMRWEDLEGLQFQGCPVCLPWSLERHGIEARPFLLGTRFDTAGRAQASSSKPGPVMYTMGWACKGHKASEPQFAQLCNTGELYTCCELTLSQVPQ